MQHPLLTLSRLGVSLVSVLLSTGSATAANGCGRVWSPTELALAAKRLDKQVVCVRALLRPLPIQDRSSIALYVYEAVPIDGKQRRTDENRIGLVDWDRELGIDESLHRLESYDLLEKAAMKCSGILKGELNYEAEFRAAVEYRKGLTERAYAALPPSLSDDKPRRSHYDTELVLLEFLKVTAICKR
jgi:hypothetical protein